MKEHFFQDAKLFLTLIQDIYLYNVMDKTLKCDVGFHCHKNT